MEDAWNPCPNTCIIVLLWRLLLHSIGIATFLWLKQQRWQGAFLLLLFSLPVAASARCSHPSTSSTTKRMRPGQQFSSVCPIFYILLDFSTSLEVSQVCRKFSLHKFKSPWMRPYQESDVWTAWNSSWEVLLSATTRVLCINLHYLSWLVKTHESLLELCFLYWALIYSGKTVTSNIHQGPCSIPAYFSTDIYTLCHRNRVSRRAVMCHETWNSCVCIH